MAKSKTTITKESRKKMKPRGKGRSGKMLDAVEAEAGSEEDFLRCVVRLGMGSKEDEDTKAIPPNYQLLSLVFGRLGPPFKAVMPMVEFEFDDHGKPHEQASQVMKAVAEGLIAPDIGSSFVGSIKSMIEIEESTELKARIEKLEAILNEESG